MARRTFVYLLTGASAAACAVQGHAQNAATAAGPAAARPDRAAADENAIIITAQKRPQALIDVPQSVSVITGETLENSHAQRLSDYLTRIPSANIVESQAGNSRIVLRGINTGGVGATVATYVDETPFGSATALANGAILTPDIDPSDLARVEVLRGPQGTLYGANSLGGLVKFVTVAPDPHAFGGTAELGIEDVSHGDMGWWGRAAVNVPLSSDTAFRASGFYRRDPGYIDDPHFGHDVNDGKTYGGRLSFMVRPTERLSVRTSVHLENIRSNGTNEVDLDPITLKPVGGSLEHTRLLRQPNDIDYRIYNTTIDYDFGPVALVSSTSYGTLDQSQIEDASGVFGPGIGVDQQMKQRRFTQELRLASTGKQTFEWTAGGFYTREKNRLGQNLFGADPSTGDPIPALDGLIIVDLPSRYREYAGFANATWHISPRFDLTAGARYSRNHQSNGQDTSGPLVGPPQSITGKSSDSVVTYAVAPTFKLNENTRIYARIAKGYRPGGPNAVSPDAPDAVPRQFGPDTTTNYEVGIKTHTDDNLFSLDLSAFRIDWKNIQLLVQIGQFGVNMNGASARSSGVEFTAGLHPSRDLSFFANGSYVDAHLTDDAPASVGGIKGDALPYNPKWQWTLGAEYEHPLSGSTTARAGISWHYTGDRRSDFNPTNGQRNLRAFGQVDAHAGLDFGRFRVDAFAHNLTDSRGIVNLGFFGDVNGDITASVIRPRSFGLALGVRY